MRDKNSHKGQNGKVMVVGGSARFHGAPILTALGAEFSGADLVFPWLPPDHIEAAKSYSLNFILNRFKVDFLSSPDVKPILQFSQSCDVAVIGPGLGDDAKTKKALKDILANIEIPVVLDAQGLIFTNNMPKTVVMTPHRGEFKELTGDEPTKENAQKWAEHFKATILIKGPEDIVADKDNVAINKTGNALMTVGGSGDVLSGLVGGLIAQGNEPFEAAKMATSILGTAGDNLAAKQQSFRALDLATEIPHHL